MRKLNYALCCIMTIAQIGHMAQIEAVKLPWGDADKKAFETILRARDAGALKFLAATMLKDVADRMNQIGLDKKLSVWLNSQLIFTEAGVMGCLYPFLKVVTSEGLQAKRYILNDFEKHSTLDDKEVSTMTKGKYSQIYDRALRFLEDEVRADLRKKGVTTGVEEKVGSYLQQIVAGKDQPGSRLSRQMGTIMWEYIPPEKKIRLFEKELAELNKHYKKVIDALRKIGDIQALLELPRSLDLSELKRYQGMMIRGPQPPVSY